MDLEKYNTSEYTIEKQMPQENNGVYTQKVYVYKGGGHPIDQGEIELTESEALELLPEKPKAIKISIDSLVKDLIGTPLFRELNNYINVSPALKLFIGDGILTPDEMVKLKAQLELDRDDQVLSVALYDYLVGKLGELENAV